MTGRERAAGTLTHVALSVDGLPATVVVDAASLEDAVLPALRAVADRPRACRRAFAFVVGPPGAGKSTLAAVLVQLLREPASAPLDIAAVGIDGFHFPHRHLTTHRSPGPGDEPLSAIKGAPETFDVAALSAHLSAARDQDLPWPTYDRRVHDVVPGVDPVRAGLVVVEGNWLLLDEPVWRDLAAHADVVISLTADPALLRDRLIERKVRGGLTRQEATDFYHRSDGRNVERFFRCSDLSRVDVALHVTHDGTIEQGDLP